MMKVVAVVFWQFFFLFFEPVIVCILGVLHVLLTWRLFPFPLSYFVLVGSHCGLLSWSRWSEHMTENKDLVNSAIPSWIISCTWGFALEHGSFSALHRGCNSTALHTY
jgi:hypothetical protein